MGDSWKPLLAITASCVGIALLWSGGPIKRAPGVLAADEPQQSPSHEAPIQLGGFELDPQASYDIEARVLSVETYKFDGGARLSPIDFAVGWGPMSDSAVLDHFRVSQGARFFTIYPGEGAIDLGTALRSAANMHLIPATLQVREQLKAVKAGNIAHLRGLLVNAHGPNGYTWNTSLTRLDTGAGACELFYVENVQTR